jgi:hypothetical protein
VQRKKLEQILKKFKTLKAIDLSWCDSLEVKNERYTSISIDIELNDFNYITHINMKFHTENPPGFIYTGKINVSDFNNRGELINQINRQVKNANIAITDAILRAAQLDMFE